MFEFVVIVIVMCGNQIDATLYSTKDFRYWEHVTHADVTEIVGEGKQFKVIHISPQLQLNTKGVYCA